MIASDRARGPSRPGQGAWLHADAVVVGAGPAGCATAYDLACRGIRVTLLDRTPFPRRKACAGGLTVKTVRALHYGIAAVLQGAAYRIAVGCRMRRPRVFDSPDPICILVERTAFDAYCLEQTRAAGARFAVVRRIHGIAESTDGVALFTDRGPIRCDFLIAADGAGSRVRRLTGRFDGFEAGFAVEGIVCRTASTTPPMGFDFDQVRGSYGWVFPKGETINVGRYRRRTGIAPRRGELVAYAASLLKGCRFWLGRGRMIRTGA